MVHMGCKAAPACRPPYSPQLREGWLVLGGGAMVGQGWAGVGRTIKAPHCWDESLLRGWGAPGPCTGRW